MSEHEISGVLVVDKPGGLTSHDVVSRIRKAYGIRRVGHAGTLDPSATGVLIVGLGRSTRLLGFIQHLPKAYVATVQFGITTSSQDAEGEVLQRVDCNFTFEDLEQLIHEFVGEIEQLPPMVSAIKVKGEPLYKAARRGEVVERKKRRVRIFSAEISEFDSASWSARMDVFCSSGTYIRTLAADIGERLGCGAHLSALRRVRIGSFDESMAVPLAAIQIASRDEQLKAVNAPSFAMKDFPSIQVVGSERDDVIHGRPLRLRQSVRKDELPVLAKSREGDMPPHEAGMNAGVPIAVMDEAGDLLAVYRKGAGTLRPQVVLVTG